MSKNKTYSGRGLAGYHAINNILKFLPEGTGGIEDDPDLYPVAARGRAAFGRSSADSYYCINDISRYFSNSSTAAIVSLDDKSTEHRSAVLSLFHSLAKASKASLEAGDRVAEMQKVFEEWEDRPQELSAALPWVLTAGKQLVSSEAKAAALRYLAVFDYLVERGALTSLLVDATKSDDYLCSLAASLSLDDIADAWTASAISAALPKIQDSRIKLRMKGTLNKIKGSKNADATPGS